MNRRFGSFAPALGKGLGWHPDLPDARDYTIGHDDVQAILAKDKQLKGKTKKLPPDVDLRQSCSSIEDQGQLGSCTANAGVGLIEYFQRRAFKRDIDASRPFLYKATRNLLGWEGDTGAYCGRHGAVRMSGNRLVGEMR